MGFATYFNALALSSSLTHCRTETAIRQKPPIVISLNKSGLRQEASSADTAHHFDFQSRRIAGLASWTINTRTPERYKPDGIPRHCASSTQSRPRHPRISYRLVTTSLNIFVYLRIHHMRQHKQPDNEQKGSNTNCYWAAYKRQTITKVYESISLSIHNRFKQSKISRQALDNKQLSDAIKD